MANITLDLDKLLEIAQKGVIRASVFMGLGINAVIEEQFKSFHLTDITNIQMLPDNKE